MLREAGSNNAPKAILSMERRILSKGRSRLYSPLAYYYVESEGHDAMSYQSTSFSPAERR
jgi:hypothetical protein